MNSLVAYDGGSSSSEAESDDDDKSSPSTSTTTNSAATLEKFQQSFALRFEGLLPKPSSNKSSSDATQGILGVSSSRIINLDGVEEEGPIPPKKIYGDEEVPPAGPDIVTANLGFATDRRTEVTATRYAKGVTRINIPSLKEFEDDPDDGSTKAKKFAPGPGKKGSGLFAILPEPKAGGSSMVSAASSGFLKTKTPGQGSSSFGSLIPHAVQQSMAGKRPAETPMSEKLAQVRAKYMKQESNFKIVSRGGAKAEKVKPKVNEGEEDEQSSDEESSDFFSLEESKSAPVDMSGVNLDEYRVSDSAEMEDMDTDTYGQEQGQGQTHFLPPPSFAETEEEEPQPEPPKNREDWMKYLQPGKQKGKVPPAPINIIDVRADDLRPAESDWLKTITDTSAIPPRKANLPGGLSKRKHQITYLAAEAKAREEELQNQWAANRHSRRQTQSKYGF